MRLYRLTRRPYANLSGNGGRRVLNRWHARFAPILYTASSRALALLEVLANLDLEFDELPDDYVFQAIDAPTTSIETVPATDIAPGGVTADTAEFGSQWLESGRTALLVVPSVIVLREANIMANPAHPEAARYTAAIEPECPWDRRLFASRRERP